MKTLVVMPAWNEAASIAPVLADVRRECPDFHIVVVDDGSTDGTADVVRAEGIDVLQLPFNLGVGGAMRAGFHYAKRNGFSRVIQVDADGQHDPSDIRAVLAGLDRADISIGARFADTGDYTVAGPRRWAMVLLSTILSRRAGTRLTDVTSGFRAANQAALDYYVRFFPVEYLGDTVESLAGALQNGLTVTQVPVSMRPRAGGRPSQNFVRSTVYLVRSMFVLSLGIVRGRRIAHKATA